MDESAPRLTALGARVHLFVHPSARDRFTALFRDLLGCEIREFDFGMGYPVALVSFPDGSAFSAEFSNLAPEDSGDAPVDDTTAFRGAWIEFRTNDVEHFQRRLHDAGIPSFRHPGSTHLYFSAPGGQVFRLIDVAYTGP
jgi:hypothetical protein